MRRTSAALLLVAALAACKSGQPFQLQNAFDSLLGDIDSLLGKSSVPAQHLMAIRDVHEPKGWQFKEDASDPLETTRRAVRALGTSDYASWGEGALTVEILSEMADEHPSSLVRAEALDTLTRMGTWTLKAAVKPPHPASYSEVIEAMKTLRDAFGKTGDDPALAAQVQGALVAMSNYDFGKLELEGDGGGDAGPMARERLRTARRALKSLLGRAIEPFQTDPGVHDALERAYVSLSSAVVRLTLAKAALADPADTTRTVAVRNFGALAPEDGATVLRAVLLGDTRSPVRREAAKSLAAYPAASAVPTLIEGLSDEMADVRGAAAGALASVTGQSFGDDRNGWLKWWQANGGKAAPGSGG
jgi:hypothetical protein